MVHKFSTEWGGRMLTIETGKIAGQANGSCTVQYGDTVVLATAVMSKNVRDGIDFFPLSVDLEERLYAAGIIKGSRFIKREGRPSDDSILSGRLIDRAIRPLFDDTLRNDIQVVATVLSFDGENDPDVLGLVAASCALTISDIPWNGPLAGIRIGQIPSSEEGRAPEWAINPTYAAREKSLIDVVVAGTPDRVLMLEAGAQEATEETMFNAIQFGQKHFKPVIDLIEEVRSKVGIEKRALAQNLDGNDETTPEQENEVLDLMKQYLDENVNKIFFSKPLQTKSERLGAFAAIEEGLDAWFQKNSIGKDRRKFAMRGFKYTVESYISDTIVKEGKRVDARSLTDIRPLSSEVGVLPRTHGSALFARGETQVLSTITLGAPGDVQLLEGIEGESKKRYMHHYNFPKYSVGETGPNRGPGRREIGHGALAEKALMPVLPPKDTFPYTIRVVSEVMSSNGSSSMGSTCGSSLALMDAGVPIKAPVAGIAMGLATLPDGSYKILTDLQDLEDGKGGMDFKIAGTSAGITAIQMDTKTKGLTAQMVKETLEQGLSARMKVLEVMNSAISAPREDLSQYAPRIVSFYIKPDKIRKVIGSGGKVINEIIDATGVDIDIEDDGLVAVTSPNKENLEKAVEWIKNLVREVEAGETFDGKVTRLMDFGAFVEVLPGQEGLVHISEMAWGRTNTVEDAVKIGDTVKVLVKEIDELGRINLSMKALLPKPEGFVEEPRFERNGGGGGSRGGRSGGHGGSGGPHRGGHGGGRPRF
ncbi:MAG TPA: polyribonucleotide nucleotidyltransferase [Candidatus Magasanikbacteria bacterium]|nr:polyribonucleotide nucleotidyltransferase [Candidatus Magasanikbacteria bacterium]